MSNLLAFRDLPAIVFYGVHLKLLSVVLLSVVLVLLVPYGKTRLNNR